MDLRHTIEFFIKDVLDNSSEEESNAYSELMVVVASPVHEHTERQRPSHRGSTRPPRFNLKHNREGGHYRMYRNYFHPTKPVFMDALFRRLYRMSRYLFLTILRGVKDYDPYFGCMPDATGKLGFSFYQKCSVTICMLAYGVVGDLLDVYLRMS
jgi:hypothetical protein